VAIATASTSRPSPGGEAPGMVDRCRSEGGRWRVHSELPPGRSVVAARKSRSNARC